MKRYAFIVRSIIVCLALGGCQTRDYQNNESSANTNPMVKDTLQPKNKYLEALNDTDEYVRAMAALELQRMGHSEALNACLQTLNDGFDPLHSEYTAAVTGLVNIGETALLPLFDSLLSNNGETRIHANTAVVEIIANLWGLKTGEEDHDKHQEFILWSKEIDYSWEEQDVASREASVDRLKAWYAEYSDSK